MPEGNNLCLPASKKIYVLEGRKKGSSDPRQDSIIDYVFPDQIRLPDRQVGPESKPITRVRRRKESPGSCLLLFCCYLFRERIGIGRSGFALK
uniref:Uncharacterized protein n=1 Tax=Picea glauca TaxID=3330 RepID=A0A101M2D6_PICGL|nr:hypothetical protein ABT39_MTgene2873 [Picea glauca]QHR87603.1 hypothetical protein Q903MT_gene1614 [Picea sitchensis]